ncbi:MAG: hypothetical protein COA42_18965 [Alteromonadaceae bacterium]|nr:MAG: hypothetical protein COA42_18965 [Alteromonadaceae bacterium]
MAHIIKSPYKQVNGGSTKAISQELEVSRNTVRKYLRMDESRDYITYLPETYPNLGASRHIDQ